MSEIIRGIIDGKFVETLCEIAFEFLAHFLRRTRITNTKYSFCCSQLLIQFIVNNTVEFYLSFVFVFVFWHLFAWAFLSIIFLTSQLKLLLYLFPFESELLLRSELPVVTLGKSLPGNCSKLGHLFAWAFLSIIFLTFQLKLLL